MAETTTYKPLADEVRREGSSAVDRAADLASEAVDRAAEVASRATSRATEYLRNRDVRGLVDDAGAYVKRHPAQALIAAAALGFVAAAWLRRR